MVRLEEPVELNRISYLNLATTHRIPMAMLRPFTPDSSHIIPQIDVQDFLFVTKELDLPTRADIKFLESRLFLISTQLRHLQGERNSAESRNLYIPLFQNRANRRLLSDLRQITRLLLHLYDILDQQNTTFSTVNDYPYKRRIIDTRGGYYYTERVVYS